MLGRQNLKGSIWISEGIKIPYANNNEIKIYYEVEGEGPPLMILHGLTNNLKDMRRYVDALKDHFQIIIIDARGHGASDKPHDPQAYRLELMSTDPVSVLDVLGINKARIFGYSMGGWLSLGIAKYAPERLNSLIIGGYSLPLGWKPEDRAALLDTFKQGMDATFAVFSEMFGDDWPLESQADFKSNDLDALIALMLSENFMDIPGYEDLLPTVKIPSLFFAGEDNWECASAPQTVKLMPNAQFVTFPGLNHVEAFNRIDLVLPHITKFLEELNPG